MKILFSLFIFMSLTAHSANDLTAEQSRDVLARLESLCSDVWCEGDTAYRFNKFSCDFKKKQCVLDFIEFPWGVEIQAKKRTCYFSPISNIDQILTTNFVANMGLNESFYNLLNTQCI